MDLLRWPIAGAFLRWRHARTSLQILLLSLAVIVIVSGLVGPDIGSANLATVLVWVHYRGLLVLALLAAGNFFCTGCPMVRVRDWGRRLHPATRHWPKALRSKWVAAALFAGVLFVYELLDVWTLPAATAWLVLVYFGAALAIDLTFSGASFCQYVCPVGQFNFLTSTMSPLEVRARDANVCANCVTADCVAGRRAPVAPHPVVQRGCELGLFLPTKVGNLDCTFCLDCVQACPHDNVGLVTRTPAIELADTRRRSVIGRLQERGDLAVLATVFVFSSLVNAFAMTAPARSMGTLVEAIAGIRDETTILVCLFVVGLVVGPAGLLGVTAWATRALARDRARGLTAIARRYVFALVPFGCGMWAAHYLFHLMTGALVVVPVAQRAVVDAFGAPWLGLPLWTWTGIRPGATFPVQVGFVILGSIGAFGVASAMADEDYPGVSRRAALPWIVAATLLAAFAIWILYQPMEMRGLSAAG